VIEYLRIYARSFLFTASGVPAALGAALSALRVLRSEEGAALLARVLDNARHLRDGLEQRGFAVVAPQQLADDEHAQRDAPGVRADAASGATIVTPIVPVLVGDDWKAALMWKGLYDAGVFVNTALHPAVPPGGALLRTSVMATHDQGTLERALDAFAAVKANFESDHGPLPGPGTK
jgi:8-amino-7-oxononanoate synthase